MDLGVCTLLLRFPWRRLETWREKCGDRFPSMRPRGYMETSEGSWNSWRHDALRLPILPVLELWKEGAYYLGLYRHAGNERSLVGVLLRFGTLS
jgi:hypothetical protein